MRLSSAIAAVLFLETGVSFSGAFPVLSPATSRRFELFSVAAADDTTDGAVAEDDELARAKAKLLGWVRPEKFLDPVLADPVSKEPLFVSTRTSTVVEDLARRKTHFSLSSETSSRTYSGTEVYINLLEPAKDPSMSTASTTEERDGMTQFLRNAAPLIPPPFRSGIDQDYVPMRDLFTSPAVSFAYERGWRQGFQQAGFPGPDREAKMAMDYFEPVMAGKSNKVLVDMSCATGLFTRRFAEGGNYSRILGCDYSDSMLQEARRRINQQWKSPPKNLQLVRLDVGQIPMQNNSIDALHAGAAMHCWPDLPAAVSEIYRVLRPGGRYFATTFLSSYFSNLQSVQGDSGPSQQAFQYFSSTSELLSLLEKGGFSRDNLSIEVFGSACVVIRGEK